MVSEGNFTLLFAGPIFWSYMCPWRIRRPHLLLWRFPSSPSWQLQSCSSPDLTSLQSSPLGPFLFIHPPNSLCSWSELDLIKPTLSPVLCSHLLCLPVLFFALEIMCFPQTSWGQHREEMMSFKCQLLWGKESWKDGLWLKLFSFVCFYWHKKS